jgi:hypothetical protein
MRLPRLSNSPLRRLAFTGLAFLGVLLSCGKDVTAPGARGLKGGLLGNLAVAPQFPEILMQSIGAGGTVPFNRVRIVLRRVDLTIALDKTVDFPASASTVPLTLDVPLLPSTTASGESLTLTLEYLNSDNAIVFTGGPTTIVVTPTLPGSTAPPAVDVPVKYSGPGASATKVVIVPKSLVVPSGAAFSFTAQALDASNAVLAGTPIVFTSLDPTLATVSATGSGTAIGVRGTARIVAQLLTGPTDIGTIIIQPVATAIALVSGSGQTNSAGATLALPLVVKVTAADGLALAGSSVTFSATTGGGTVTATATTDASGNAQATWKLGATVGAQSVTANGGTAGQVVFTATAIAATPTKLVVTSAPTSGTATSPLANFVVTAQDASNNIASAFTGPVTVALGGGTAGATLSGTTTVNAVGGVATFTALGIGKAGTAYTLTASASGLTSATSAPFDIVAGTANKLVFTGQPTDALAGASVGTLTVAVQDASGNPITTFTGSVTLGFALNPGTAAIGGTTTVNAIAGVATFTGISLNRPGSGYAFVASASGLSSANSTTFSIAVGPATQLTLVSGGGQTALSSAALAQPIVVQVTDAVGNPITGKALTFAVVTGVGAVSPSSTTTVTGGLASTNWTLGALGGAQTMTVSGTGLTQSPLTVTATASGAGAATQLVITTQPSNSTGGTAIASSIVVTTKDVLNNVATGFSGNITLAIGTNPGPATLSGTFTVAAVSGVATFPGITLDKVGAGYTLVASASGLTSATTNSFNITTGPATTTTITAGNAQAGSISAALSTALQVKVADAGGNPVTGTTATWSVTGGGGSVAPGSSVTNASGLASTMWTLGPVIGAQSAQATAAGAPVAFTATASSALANKVWNGSSGTAWSTAANWSPAGAPAASDSVIIPVTAQNPVLPSGTTTVKALYVNSGASLTLSTSTLVINGNVVATGPIGGTGTIALASSTAATVNGSFNGTVTVIGPYSANAAITTQGLIVSGVSGSFDANGQVIAINGAMQTLGSGKLRMTAVGSAVNVTGNASFGGGSTLGLLTNGVLSVSGNFAEGGGSVSAFAASPGHQTVLNGAGAQTISFVDAGPSGFGSLTTNGSSFSTSTNVTVSDLTLTAGNFVGTGVGISIFGTLTDPSGLLQFGSISFGGSTAPVSASTPAITVTGGGSLTFNNNPSILAANLNITATTVFVLGNLSLTSHTLAVAGHFATSSAGQLTMSNALDSVKVSGNVTFGSTSAGGPMTNGVMLVGGNFTQSGSAQSLSASTSNTIVFNGAGAQTVNFSNPDGAYTTGCAASCFANLNITKASGSVAFQTMTKIAGAFTNLSAAPLTTPATNGDFIIVGAAQLAGNGAYSKIGLASGTYGKSGLTSVDTVVYFGTGQTYLPSALGESFDDIRGTVNWLSAAILAGNMQVNTGGQLNVATSGAVINGKLTTSGTGTIKMMTNATDSLHVKGLVQFGGGSTDGLLTTGFFIADSTFDIGGLSYSSTANHTTVLGGANLQNILVSSPIAGKGFNKVWARGTGEKKLANAIVYAARVDIGASVTSGVTGFTWVLSGGITDSSSMSGGAWRPNATNFTVAPSVLPRNLNGNVAFKAGIVTLADTLYVGANTIPPQAQVVVDGGSTVLTLNGFKLQIDTVVGVFTTQNGGKLNMMNAADTLKASTFFFGGGNGTMNAGTILAFGNFTQSASVNAFVASGSHKTIGAKTATYSFANPTTSYFNDFTIVAGSTVTLSSDVTIKGTLGFSGSLAATFTDTSLRTITASGLNLPGLYPVNFTNVALNYVDGVIGATVFNNGRFSGFGAFFTGSMLSLNRTSGLPPTFSNLAFAGTLSDGVGRYISNTGSIPLALVSATPNSTAALIICGCTGTNYRSVTGVTWP